MAALRSLISGALPPVGQRARLGGALEPPPEFEGYEALWTASGTAGLAIAIRKAASRRADTDDPVVLLPAYGCPDLVAAAVFAGVRPVLVDTESEVPRFDSAAFEAAIADNVVAVVAVNFLGLRERVTELKALVAEHNALLIEDCAQWYPEDGLTADAVVLSFGRGKPVNLLGGGGVLFRVELGVEAPDLEESAAPAWPRLQSCVFNTLLDRYVFALVSRIPQLKVGKTRYVPLRSVARLDARRLGRLRSAARAWLERPLWRERYLDTSLDGLSGVSPLPVAASAYRGRLLRYPLVFASRPQRDAAFERLTDHGLGASKFYERSLPGVPGVADELEITDGFNGAETLAETLLTLPVHDGVTERVLERTAKVIESIADGTDRGS